MDPYQKIFGDDRNKKCQKCLNHGHWTYECTKKAAYLYKPSMSVRGERRCMPVQSSLYDEPPSYNIRKSRKWDQNPVKKTEETVKQEKEESEVVREEQIEKVASPVIETEKEPGELNKEEKTGLLAQVKIKESPEQKEPRKGLLSQIKVEEKKSSSPSIQSIREPSSSISSLDSDRNTRNRHKHNKTQRRRRKRSQSSQSSLDSIRSDRKRKRKRYN